MFAGACGAGAYRARSGEYPVGNNCGDGAGDAAAIKMNANKNA